MTTRLSTGAHYSMIVYSLEPYGCEQTHPAGRASFTLDEAIINSTTIITNLQKACNFHTLF
jgi:hypothetical protein